MVGSTPIDLSLNQTITAGEGTEISLTVTLDSHRKADIAAVGVILDTTLFEINGQTITFAMPAADVAFTIQFLSGSITPMDRPIAVP